MMPAIRSRIPGASFWIVGAQPSARVQNLASIPRVTSPGRSPISGRGSGAPAVYASPLRFGLDRKEQDSGGDGFGRADRCNVAKPLRTPVDRRAAAALIADDDAEFTEAVVRLLSSPELCDRYHARLGEKRKRSLLLGFDPSAFEGLYREVLTQRQVAA